MAERIRAKDWSATAWGEPESWPQSLRSALSICPHSSIPTSIYWGRDHRLIYNDAWSPIPAERHPWALGLPAAAVWTDIWDVVEPQLARVYESGEGFSTFDQMLPMRRGGSVEETYWNYSFSPIRGEDGAVVGIFNQGHETTDRVLAERRAAAELDRLNAMFAQAPGFMAMLRGPEHRFELTNASYVQLIGHRDVVGKTVREALPDIEGQGFYELLDRVFQTGEAFVGNGLSVELQARPNGPVERRFVDLVYQPIFADDGTVSGIFAQGNDVTARVAAEAELRESEAQFRRLIEHAPDKMWVNHADGTVSYFNQSWRDYTGHPLTPAGLSWTEAFHPDDRAALVDIRTRSIAAGIGYTVEARMLRHEDSSWRWHVCRVAPVRRGDEIVAWVGMAADVDDLRSAQHQLAALNRTLESRVAERTSDLHAVHEQLRQSQKMEAIGQLTGGLAHDLNNMLTVVSGNLDLARRSLSGGDEARAARCMGQAIRGAESAAALTKRLLAFARRQPLEPKLLDATALVGDMTELLRRSLGETISLDVEADGFPLAIRADSHALENAILNLAVNARDAMTTGGRLSIAVSGRKLDEAAAGALELEAGDHVEVAVSDTGYGMDSTTLARALDPFFTTKEQGKGTGLGLSMVYGFVKQSHGAISIDSRVGEGTTVRLLFPRVHGAEALEAGDALAEPGRKGSETILIVEDQEDVAELAATILSDAGYQVITCASGEEALARFDDLPEVSLVFSDVVMPGNVSGTVLAREMRKRRPGIKILLTTGYSAESIERSGEFDYLGKPYRLTELLERVGAALES
jgi:PAS domain S-box-containing protein